MEAEYIAYDIRSFIVLGAEEDLNSVCIKKGKIVCPHLTED